MQNQENIVIRPLQMDEDRLRRYRRDLMKAVVFSLSEIRGSIIQLIIIAIALGIMIMGYENEKRYLPVYIWFVVNTNILVHGYILGYKSPTPLEYTIYKYMHTVVYILCMLVGTVIISIFHDHYHKTLYLYSVLFVVFFYFKLLMLFIIRQNNYLMVPYILTIIAPNSMPDADIDAMSTVDYRDGAEVRIRNDTIILGEQSRTCSICLEDFVADEKLLITGCKHYYHDDCIRPWLRCNASCPLCNQDPRINTSNSNTTTDSETMVEIHNV